MKIKFSHVVASVSAFAFLALVSAIAYIVVSQARMKEEQKRVDAEVEKIKGEITVRQCRIDRIYCCRRNDREACARWSDSGCLTDSGSPDIDCKAK
ncbi:MAG: hypothetical protein LBI17_00575 [Rickettsiales bacterium]|jgi:hypothetical protein|nr:hypothetical protein [Rickettsiales bacterium]